MKKISVLFLLSIISLSCLAQKNTYEIIGDVKNIPSKWVYLRLMKRDSNEKLYWPIVDSALVINGKFRLHKDTVLTDPAWASSLSYKDSVSNKLVQFSFINPKEKGGKVIKHGNFILENTKQTITGDGATVIINGSKEMDYNMKYGLMQAPSLRNINKKIDSLQSTAATSALQEAMEERDAMIKKYKEDFMTMVKDNPSTWLAVLNVYQNAAAFSPEELDKMVALFDKEVMTTARGQALIKHISQSRLLLQSKPFPDFKYVNSESKKFQLDQLKGKKGTLIVFWASWCGPCRQEIPELKAFYNAYKNQGINLISISTDHNISDWKKALEKEKMPWPNLANLPGNHKEILAKFNIQAIPAMFLLDKENKIVLADPNDFQLIKNKAEALVKGI